MLRQRHHEVVNQAGIVSFMVTLFIMMMLTLIVLGFAAITRREQRQALDDQLSTQAFYAAESGINDAVKVIKSGSLNASYTNNCGDFISAYNLNNTLDSSGGVQYTCLLVNNSLTSLEYNPLSSANSLIVPISASNGNAIGKITIGWQDTDSSNNTFCPTLGQFTPVGNSWPCTTGVVRVDIVPATSLHRTDLLASQMTVFLYPNSGATKNPLTYNAGDSGAISAGKCATNKSPYCSVTISGLNASQYYLRLRSIYRDTSVKITAKDTGSNSVQLVGAQATIDSTGRAQDILRRVQVRLPLTSSPTFPEFSIQTGDSICKQLQIFNGTTYYPAGIDACDPTR